MPRDGRNFELLTQALEKYIAEEGTTVESPGYVEDRITGKMREIDVLIMRGEGHHKQLIAIECKDRKTPVGVPDVEAFNTKIQDLKINKAVFVSSSGFRKTAVTKAQFYNISCLDIDEIDEFEWLLADCIHYHEKKLLKTHWVINADNKELESATNLIVKNKAGEEVTNEILAANSRRVFNGLDLSQCEIGKVYGQEFPVSHDELIIVDADTGNEYPVCVCKVYLEWQQTVTDLPFKRVKYGDVAEEKDIAKAAVAELNLGEREGHIMMVEQEDGSTQVVITTNKNA